MSVRWACLMPVALVLLCSPSSARAQSLGACTAQVLSAPTESSVQVRLKGVHQWPANPICFWETNQVGTNGQAFLWQAVLIGDGLVGPPEMVDVSVQFRYAGSMGCGRIALDFFPPFPSAPFTNFVTSAGAFVDPGCGPSDPPLSFQGTLSLDVATNLTVDIVFTGGAVDSDGDGVLDGTDACPNTPAGAVVDASGCSIDQLAPCAGPWKNHGQYAVAVLRTAKAFQAAGLITKGEEKSIVSAAVKSDCGRRHQRK